MGVIDEAIERLWQRIMARLRSRHRLFEEPKFCEQCQAADQRSKIFILQVSRTKIPYNPFYDELGNFCDNDPNITTIEFKCSRGHEWKEEKKGSGHETFVGAIPKQI
jgi:hypothetical protein